MSSCPCSTRSLPVYLTTMRLRLLLMAEPMMAMAMMMPMVGVAVLAVLGTSQPRTLSSWRAMEVVAKACSSI